MRVGLVDLHDGQTDGLQVPGQPGTVGAGGLHADHPHRSPAPQPLLGSDVASRGGRKLRVAKAPPERVEGGEPVRLVMTVHTADHSAFDVHPALGHAGHVVPPQSRRDRPGPGGHNSDGTLGGSSSYEVTSARTGRNRGEGRQRLRPADQS